MRLRKKVVIFDFDGTLADTFPVGTEIITEIAKKRGHVLTNKSFNDFRNMKVRDFMKKYNVGNLRVYFAIRKMRQALTSRMGEVKLFPHLHEELFKLHKAGYRLGILSSNDKKNIDIFLKNNGLDDIFDFVFSERNIFAKSSKLKFLIRFFKLTRHDIVYVGDEVRDVEAAQKAGVKIVAVSWGYNSEKLLGKSKPDKLISNEISLLSTIKSL